MVLERECKDTLSDACMTVSSSLPQKPLALGTVDDPGNPWRALIGSDSPLLDDLLEGLVYWARHKFGADEFVRAREEYYEKAGKVFEEDSFFLTRMNYFIDFFLFERPLPKGKSVALELSDQTPFDVFQRFGRTEVPSFSPSIAERLNDLGSFSHSIFLVSKIRDQEMFVTDLLNGERLIIRPKETETFKGFCKKDIFQSFIFNYDRKHRLGSGVIIHPAEARKTIRRYLKDAQKSPEYHRNKVLYRLARQHIRHLRHGHVDPRLIYAADPR
jgi:hypothetical protein